jgi:hypothetical protein
MNKDKEKDIKDKEKEKEKKEGKRLLDKNLTLGKKLILSKMGLVKKSPHSSEFNEKNKKFKAIDNHYEEVSKIGKDYSKTLSTFCTFEQQLGEEFSNFAGESHFKTRYYK